MQTRKPPAILFKRACICGVNTAWNTEGRNSFVFENNISYSFVEFGSYQFPLSAKRSSIKFLTSASYHQIKHDGIVEYSFSIAIENDSSFRINKFLEKTALSIASLLYLPETTCRLNNWAMIIRKRQER
jgi:hypothetical protein